MNWFRRKLVGISNEEIKNIEGFQIGRSLTKGMSDDPIFKDEEFKYLLDIIDKEVENNELHIASVVVDICRKLKLKNRKNELVS